MEPHTNLGRQSIMPLDAAEPAQPMQENISNAAADAWVVKTTDQMISKSESVYAMTPRVEFAKSTAEDLGTETESLESESHESSPAKFAQSPDKGAKTTSFGQRVRRFFSRKSGSPRNEKTTKSKGKHRLCGCICAQKHKDDVAPEVGLVQKKSESPSPRDKQTAVKPK